MEDQKIGRTVRALRRRLRWRQADLALATHCSQTTISLLERGHLEHVSLPLLRKVLAALDATLAMDIWWRGAGLDRLLDEDHAHLVAHVAKVLIAELETMKGDEEHWEAKFKVLAESVRHHIKEEKGGCFRKREGLISTLSRSGSA